MKEKTDGSFKSFNFKAPDHVETAENEVLFPWHNTQEPSYATPLAVTITQQETILKPATLNGVLTINLTVDSQVTAGAKLHIKITADEADRVVTLGTGFDTAAANPTVPATGTMFASFVYDGTVFMPCKDESYLLALIDGLTGRVEELEGLIS